MFDATIDPSKVSAAVKLLKGVYDQAVNNTVDRLSDSKKQQGVVSLLSPHLREIYGQFINQHEIEMVIERGVKMANDMVRQPLTRIEILDAHANIFGHPDMDHVLDTAPEDSDISLEFISFVNSTCRVGNRPFFVEDLDTHRLSIVKCYIDRDDYLRRVVRIVWGYPEEEDSIVESFQRQIVMLNRQLRFGPQLGA
jgi:hypothetical protein